MRSHPWDFPCPFYPHFILSFLDLCIPKISQDLFRGPRHVRHFKFETPSRASVSVDRVGFNPTDVVQQYINRLGICALKIS